MSDKEKQKSNGSPEKDEKEMDKSLQEDNPPEGDNDVEMIEISDEEPEKCDEDVGNKPKCDEESLRKMDDAIDSVVQKALEGSLSVKDKSSPAKRTKSFQTPSKEGTSATSESASPLSKSASKLQKGQKTIFDMMKKLPATRKLDVGVTSIVTLGKTQAKKRPSSGTTGAAPEKAIKVDATDVIDFDEFTKETTKDPVIVIDEEESKREEAAIKDDKPTDKSSRVKSKRIEANKAEEEKKKKEAPAPTPKSPGAVKKIEERKKQQLEKRKSIKLQKEQEKKEKEEQRKQKKLEEEERKKQKKLEEEERKKQKKLEDEKRKIQKKLEEEQERMKKLEMKKKIQEEKEEAKRKEKEKKEAERQKKEAERLKKEQERQKAVEEKQKAMEESQRQKEKRANHFKSFFLKPTTKPLNPSCDVKAESIGQFHAFQVKEGMYLAPTVRVKWGEDQKSALDDELSKENESVLQAWFKKIKSTPQRSEATVPKQGSEQLKKQEDDDNDVCNTRAKLLQFRENYRPPYYGTWRKTSELISPRNPFKQDKEQLDYEFESDDEWEEPVEGEDIVNSEGEEDATENATENDDDEDEDGFFVPHGYLSNDEGINDEDDDSDTECKEDISDQRLKAKQLEFESKWKQKLKVLNPISIGCLYDDGDPNLLKKYNEMFLGYGWKFLCDRPINLDAVEPKKEQPTKTKPVKVKTVKAPKVVPKEAIPDLVRLCHGNPYGVQRLAREFQKYWELKTSDSLPAGGGPLKENEKPYVAPKPENVTDTKQQTDTNAATSSKATGVVIAATNRAPRSEGKISRSQLVKKIKEMTVYGRKENLSRQCWFVIDSAFEEYGLDRQSFPIPCRWGFVTYVPGIRVDILPPPLPPTTVDPTVSSQNITSVATAVSQLTAAASAKISPITTETAKAAPDKNESGGASAAQENAPVSNPMSKYISKTNPVELLENSHKRAQAKGRRVALTTVPLTTTPRPPPEVAEESSEVETGFGFSQPSKAAFRSLFKLVNSPKKSNNQTATTTVTPPATESNKQDENSKVHTIDLT